ncbi:MAG: DUF2927 domain-containing protein [Roseivivax sp.]|nr:DUF2927 domain-containing protein [Roseivivax sp.]
MRKTAGRALTVLALALAGGCQMAAPYSPAEAPPQPRPQAALPAPAQPDGPSATSRELTSYYARVQADLLAQGLLRTDGGGPDTPFDGAALLRNFERIALSDEYSQGAGLVAAPVTTGPVKKWVKPVRVRAEFGGSVPPAQRALDRAELATYVGRLGRVTGHPISMTDIAPNFHVFFAGEDDRATLVPRIRQVVPDIDAASLNLIQSMPRSIYCFVIAFADSRNGSAYDQAVAVIRAEQSGLMRKSCIHEEVAQGLGLANDSPYARPSIFNDDDEFALLTTHDEMLLRILYDPRLTPGMSAEAALPIVEDLASRLAGGPS